MREKKVDAAYRDLNDFPDQHTLILQDWWPQPFMDVFTVMHSAGNYYPSAVGELSTIGSPYSTSNLPDGSDHGSIPFYSGLINGKGKHRDVPFEKSRLATFKVDYMKSYRFRVIGGQSLFGYKISIDQHKLTVISTDGFLTQPISQVDYLIVYPGERFDFILNADANPAKYYWIRIETLEVNITDTMQGLRIRRLGTLCGLFCIIHMRKSPVRRTTLTSSPLHRTLALSPLHVSLLTVPSKLSICHITQDV